MGDKMTLSKAAQAERDQLREESLARLREVLKPGDTVSTIVTHVARSGMSRSIECYTVSKGEIRNITRDVARVIDNPIDERNGGVKMGGCGMDMGFAAVYALSSSMFRNGFRCAGKKCGSNDHVNPRSYPSETIPGTALVNQPGYIGPYPRDGRMRHRGDGGYALNQRWM